MNGLLYAQQTFADSLASALLNTPADTHKVKLYNDLAWELKVGQPDKARQYLDSALLLARQLHFRKGEAQAFNNRGVVEVIHNQPTAAKSFMQQALDIRKELGDVKGTASLYNNIGNLEDELGNFELAVENLRKSLRLREELGDTLRTARTSYNLAIVYESRGFYPEALDYVFRHLSISERLADDYEIANAENLIGNIKSELEQFAEAAEHYDRALVLRRQFDDPWALADVLNNIGNNKDDFGERYLKDEHFDEAFPLFQQAIEYYQNALDIYLQHEDPEGEGAIYNNIGLVYKNLGSYYKDIEQAKDADLAFEKAHSYLQRSLDIRKSIDDEKGIMEVYNGIGDVYRRQNKLEEALKYTDAYLDLAKELNDTKFKQKAYKDLSRVYADMGKYKKAYKNRKKYDETRYERLNEDIARNYQRREALYSDQKKQLELERQQNQLALQEANLRQASLQRKTLFGGIIGLLLLALLLYNRYRLKHRSNLELEGKNQIIEQERERAEALLLNILPEETAAELKTHGKARAKRYEAVTVMFTDFEAFTKVAEQMEPEELVAELDECFRAFDQIIGRYGLEKIKTIGDSYMCAGGLPQPNDSHPENMIRAAMEIQQFMHNYQQQRNSVQRPSFRCRIGIHTGPVVAGIVGSKKFAYDIWGDTVNLAARMESGGVPGRINISKSTYELVKETFACSHRGKISVKNMGEVDMFFVEKPRTNTDLSQKVTIIDSSTSG